MRDRPSLIRILVVLGLLFQCAVLGPALIWSFAPDAPLNDFVSFYSGGALAGDPALYDPNAMQDLQQQLGVRADQHRMAFIRPPFYAVLLSPFAALPYRYAYAVWQILACAAFLAIGWLWVRLLNSTAPALVLAWSLPVGYSLLRGQDVHVFLLLYTLAVVLFTRGRHFAAGALLALALMKWIFLLCLPVLIVRRRLWRVAAGFCTAAAVLAVIGVLAQGYHWPELYAHAVLRPSASPNLFSMPTLRGMVHALPLSAVLEVLAAIAVLGTFWFHAGGEPVAARVWAAQLFAGLLVAHHAYLYDAAILIPPLAVALFCSSVFVRIAAALLVLPFLWGAMLFPGWAYLTQAVMLLVFVAYTSRSNRGTAGRELSSEAVNSQ